MWKALHQLAIPERLYRLCGCWIPPAGGVERAVAGHRSGVGLWLRPGGLSAGGKLPDHVSSCPGGDVVDGAVRRWPLRPSSGWSGRSKWPTAIAAPAPVGAICTRWRWSAARRGASQCGGDWWIWDARLTSELVLLFLYAGVIALWHAFDDRRLAGRAAGILVLVGVVNLPIIHYSVYWWNTLHRGSTNLQQTIDPSMRLPLRICIFAFLTLSVTLTLMRLRNLILQLERRRPWVVALANKGAVR